MASEEKALAAVDEAGRGLRVVFHRAGDRWAHRIEYLDGAQATVVWQSIEGSASDDWPPSPALQDISVERLPDGRDVIFLVGKAGSSHWSASVEALLSPSRLVFDIACRHGTSLGALGSRYARKHLENVAARSELEGTLVNESESQLAIHPLSIPSAKVLQTTRWKYSVGDVSHA